MNSYSRRKDEDDRVLSDIAREQKMEKYKICSVCNKLRSTIINDTCMVCSQQESASDVSKEEKNNTIIDSVISIRKEMFYEPTDFSSETLPTSDPIKKQKNSKKLVKRRWWRLRK